MKVNNLSSSITKEKLNLRSHDQENKWDQLILCLFSAFPYFLVGLRFTAITLGLSFGSFLWFLCFFIVVCAVPHSVGEYNMFGLWCFKSVQIFFVFP